MIWACAARLGRAVSTRRRGGPAAGTSVRTSRAVPGEWARPSCGRAGPAPCDGARRRPAVTHEQRPPPGRAGLVDADTDEVRAPMVAPGDDPRLATATIGLASGYSAAGPCGPILTSPCPGAGREEYPRRKPILVPPGEPRRCPRGVPCPTSPRPRSPSSCSGLRRRRRAASSPTEALRTLNERYTVIDGEADPSELIDSCLPRGLRHHRPAGPAARNAWSGPQAARHPQRRGQLLPERRLRGLLRAWRERGRLHAHVRQAVAEFSLGLAIDLARGISREDRAFREGREGYVFQSTGDSILLRGSAMGILGYGNIGRNCCPCWSRSAPRSCAATTRGCPTRSSVRRAWSRHRWRRRCRTAPSSSCWPPSPTSRPTCSTPRTCASFPRELAWSSRAAPRSWTSRPWSGTPTRVGSMSPPTCGLTSRLRRSSRAPGREHGPPGPPRRRHPAGLRRHR